MNPPDHTRRLNDAASDDTGSMSLLVYQLGEIKVQLRDGFATADRRSENMDLKIDLMAKAISDLQRFQAATEARSAALAETGNQVNARWVPIGLALMSALVAVIIVLAQT